MSSPIDNSSSILTQLQPTDDVGANQLDSVNTNQPNSASQLSAEDQVERVLSQLQPTFTSLSKLENTQNAHTETVYSQQSLHAESGGKEGSAAVGALNLTAAKLSSMHVVAVPSHSLADKGNCVADDSVERERKPKRNKNGASEHKESDAEKERNTPDEDASPGGILERRVKNNHDARYAQIFRALVHAGQYDTLRQLEPEKRIAIVFPVDDHECESEADIYLMWRSTIGVRRIVKIHAFLITSSKYLQTATWLMVRAFQDRSHDGIWRLVIQSNRPESSKVHIHIGEIRNSFISQNDISILVPDALRFWSNLNGQFSLVVMISSLSIKHWIHI